MIELVALRTQTHFDIAKTLPIRQLRKGHAQILVKSGELSHLPVPAITRHTAPECMQGQMPHQLRKNQFASVHASPRDCWTKHLEPHSEANTVQVGDTRKSRKITNTSAS